MTKNQKKNIKRNAKAKAAKIEAQYTEALLELPSAPSIAPTIRSVPIETAPVTVESEPMLDDEAPAISDKDSKGEDSLNSETTTNAHDMSSFMVKMTKNQKKNQKRYLKAKVAEAEANQANDLLELEAHGMLFPSWQLGASTIPSVAPTAVSVPAATTIPVSIPAIVAPASTASEPVSDDESSVGSAKHSKGESSPSSQSSVSIEDIEKVPALLNAAASSPLMKASTDFMPAGMVVDSTPAEVEAEPLRPSLCRRFRDAQPAEARNLTRLTLTTCMTQEGVSILLPGPDGMLLSKDDFFNAAMVPEFVGMPPSLSNLRVSMSDITRPTGASDRLLMSPPIAFPQMVDRYTLPAAAPVGSTPIPMMTQTPMVIDRAMRVHRVSAPLPVASPVATASSVVSASIATMTSTTIIIDEIVPEPEIVELFGAPLAHIDSSFSDTKDDDDIFEPFGSPLPEIDSSFSDEEEEAEIAPTIQLDEATKSKKVKVQAEEPVNVALSAAVAEEILLQAPPATTTAVPEQPILFENFTTEVDMKEIKALSAKCAIGGSMFMVGCAGVGALVGWIFKG